jgi:excinuclease ABC C subunit
MMKHAADVDVTVVHSELEAFILESNLIKELKPKYNIMLKDDKGYVYVRVAVQEKYPSVEVVRRLEDDGAKYFGPFLGAYGTNASLDMLDGILHYRACRKSLDALNHPTPGGAKALGTPCLEHQIGKCCGLCIGSVTQQEYRERIEEVQRFFRGNFQSVKKRAEAAMLDAASHKKFERAARLRDVLKFIAELESKQVVSDASGENADVFGIAYRHNKMHVVLLRERDGKVIEQVHLALKGEAENAAEAMGQFLPQYYADTQDIPDLILVRDPLPESVLLAEWLKQKRGKSVEIRVPERGKKSKLLELAEKNAEEKVRQQFAAWEAELRKAEDAVQSLQSLLKLPHPPRRIEGYDISHLGGTETVGSMVVFENGKPKRAHYRSFNITTVKRGDIDDYQSLAEVLRRRLKYVAFDLKSDVQRLEKAGVEVGKARKPEQKRIDAIAQAHAEYLQGDTSSYKEFFVARRDKEIVGVAQLAVRASGLRVLQCVWCAEGEDEQVRRTLIRTVLQSQEKGKVYALVEPKQEEQYAQLGFRHVIEAHPELDTRVKALQQKEVSSTALLRTVLSYDVRKEKPDESFASVPDVLLIDGGKGQLGAVYDVLREMGLHQAISLVSLAKREEEIFVPDHPAPLLVPAGDAAQFLLQRIRDESHRFANEKRKGRAAKTTFASALDDVQGIGPQLKKELLLRFGSVDRIRDADDDALRAILNEKQLDALRKQFSA